MKLNCKRIDFTYTPGEEIFNFPEESGLPFLFDVEEELTADSAAMEDWNNTTNHAALRCPPMIFPLPKGQDSNTAEFAIILKMDNDGDTVVYSPIPLPHLENQ